MRWLLMCGVLLVAACGTDDLPIVGSDCDADQVATNLDEVAERWDDAVDVALTTSRLAIAGPISDLQEIRRETRQQEWPECAADAQSELVEWMDGTIDALLAFAGQEDDAVVQEHLEDADAHRVAFRRELRELRGD